MIGPELGLVLIGLALVLYALTGGADYGAGLWDLCARGPRAEQRRNALHEAIAPVWEANHVWVLYALVILLTAFPQGYALILDALHIPLSLALLGMVLRGSAYTFRAYGIGANRAKRKWGLAYSLSSVFTPFWLGAMAGGLASGEIRVTDGVLSSEPLAGWSNPFALGVGLLTLALFAFLAAVYMTCESEGELREDFRLSALRGSTLAFLAAIGVWLLGQGFAADMHAELSTSAWSVLLHAGTAAASLTAFYALYKRRYTLARLAAIAQVSGIVCGWGLAMNGHLILPDVSASSVAAPPAVLRAMLIISAVGTLLLIPALFWLVRVFKSQRTRSPEGPSTR